MYYSFWNDWDTINTKLMLSARCTLPRLEENISVLFTVSAYAYLDYGSAACKEALA
jgi:hypothetical protein